MTTGIFKPDLPTESWWLWIIQFFFDHTAVFQGLHNFFFEKKKLLKRLHLNEATQAIILAFNTLLHRMFLFLRLKDAIFCFVSVPIK
jgi:hypothetical protein